jgi:uncharacterized membrane protein
MEPYVLLKFVHVLSAVVAVGFNASYGIWLARAARQPDHLGHVLRGIKTLDNVANLGYGVLLLTGLLLIWVGGIPLTTLWIAAALLLYVVGVILLGLGVYAPALRAQLRALENAGPESPEYTRLASQNTTLGIAIGVIVVVIVFLMVTKPTLA